MKISRNNPFVRIITFFKLSTLLIKKFHYTEGEFDGHNYITHHVNNFWYYKKYKNSFIIDLKIYNPQEFKVFILSLLRNIANFFVSITLFPIYTHYYATRGVILQFKFLIKEMKGQNSREAAQNLEFNGFPHLIVSFILAPIVFLLNCFFIEPLERFLYSFICVTVLQIICILKLVPYAVLIVVSPLFVSIALTWVIIRFTYKLLSSSYKAIFKKIRVA